MTMPESTSDPVSDLVRKSYAAFFSKDRKTMEDLLSEDFVFNSPQDDHLNRSAYFERCFPNSSEFQAHTIEQLFVSGNEALVRYQAELRNGARFRNVEYIQTDGEKIKEVDVYFGSQINTRQSQNARK